MTTKPNTKADLEKKLNGQMLAALTPEFWRKCNICKKPIGYKSKYWVCNVSTCNRKRVGLVFCDVACWDAHLPGMNHRESWAEDRVSPVFEDWKKTLEGHDETPKRASKKTATENQAASPSTASNTASGASPNTSKPAVVLRKRPGSS